MRRFIARIALLAVASLGFISIIGAAPASATNCTNIYNDPIIRYTDQGYQVMGFYAHVGSCTSDTNQLQFRYSGSGFRDYGLPPGGNGYVLHQAYLSGGTSDVTVSAPPAPWYSTVLYAQTCWYGAGVMHIQKSTFWWRISNFSGVWGSWHQYVRNVQEGITC